MPLRRTALARRSRLTAWAASLGCAGDWDPGCEETTLTAGAGASYARTFDVPAGSNELKVAITTTTVAGGLTGDRLVSGLDPTDKGTNHGGDLKGVVNTLDYIKNLGTTAIWLTPLFKNRPVQGTEADVPPSSRRRLTSRGPAPRRRTCCGCASPRRCSGSARPT